MYIQVTIDLKNYTGDVFDLRLSNYHSIKKLIEIVWEAKNISAPPKEGYWVRVQNKEFVCSGNEALHRFNITSGDRLEIL